MIDPLESAAELVAQKSVGLRQPFPNHTSHDPWVVALIVSPWDVKAKG
jgi:hypothetical protein